MLWLAALALAAVAAALAAPAYLPFQDLPNHDLVLAAARALRGGAESPYLQLADVTVFGYTLPARIDQLLAPFLSTTASLRLQLVVAALALPLAAGMLARRQGQTVSAAWAVLLSAPLAISWPMRMGFVSYVEGLPPALAAAAVAIDVVAAPRAGRAVLLAVLLALALLAHPLALAVAGLLMAAVWAGRPGGRSALALLAAALPTALLLGHDLLAGGYRPVEDTAVLSTGYDLEGFRNPALALAQLVTLTFGVDRPLHLLFYAPLAAIVLAMWRPPGRALGIATAVMLLAALLVPSWLFGAFLVGQRLPVVVWCLLAATAAARIGRASRSVRGAALAAVLLALGWQAVDLHAQGAAVAAIVGERPPRGLEGRRLTAVVSCAPRAWGVWGGGETERHLWAYAVAPARGFTPYLFAYRRYAPVWIRRGQLPRALPVENEVSGRPDLASCADFDGDARVEALFRAMPIGGRMRFEEPIVVGGPDWLARLSPRHAVAARVAPGIVTLTRAPEAR